MSFKTLSLTLIVAAMGLLTAITPTFGLMIDSADFDYKYEMDLLPTDPAAIDLDNNGLADWINWPGKVACTVSGGVLTIPDNSVLASGFVFDLSSTPPGVADENAVWPQAIFTCEEGLAYEFSARIVSGSGTTGALPLAIAPSDTQELLSLYIGTNFVKVWYGAATQTLLAGVDNTDAQHVYRIARNATADGGLWWFWRDGELLNLNEEGAVCTKLIDRNCTYMGPGIGSTTTGVSEIDYIRLTHGDGFVYLPGDASGDGVVNSADAAILAENWLATGAGWGTGDFNRDGVVNDIDATIMAVNWGKTYPASSAVPEPGMLTLLGLGALGLFLSCLIQKKGKRKC